MWFEQQCCRLSRSGCPAGGRAPPPCPPHLALKFWNLISGVRVKGWRPRPDLPGRGVCVKSFTPWAAVEGDWGVRQQQWGVGSRGTASPGLSAAVHASSRLTSQGPTRKAQEVCPHIRRRCNWLLCFSAGGSGRGLGLVSGLHRRWKIPSYGPVPDVLQVWGLRSEREWNLCKSIWMFDLNLANCGL